MSLHESDIKSRLSRFLDRKHMPKRLEGKGGAMEDEIRALVAAIVRNAPRTADRLADWWPIFEATLSEDCGPMWPTEREIRDAAKKAHRDAPKAQAVDWVIDPAELASRRMAAGEPVGDSWIYGIGACELAARRLVTEDQMRAYRSAAFFHRKDVLGEENALAWEAEQKARHEQAKDIWAHRNDPRGHRSAQMPSKRTSELKTEI